MIVSCSEAFCGCVRVCMCVSLLSRCVVTALVKVVFSVLKFVMVVSVTKIRHLYQTVGKIYGVFTSSGSLSSVVVLKQGVQWKLSGFSGMCFTCAFIKRATHFDWLEWNLRISGCLTSSLDL